MELLHEVRDGWVHGRHRLPVLLSQQLLRTNAEIGQFEGLDEVVEVCAGACFDCGAQLVVGLGCQDDDWNPLGRRLELPYDERPIEAGQVQVKQDEEVSVPVFLAAALQPLFELFLQLSGLAGDVEVREDLPDLFEEALVIGGDHRTGDVSRLGTGHWSTSLTP